MYRGIGKVNRFKVTKPYIIFNPHSEENVTESKHSRPYTQIASIDPGAVWFCILIEKYNSLGKETLTHDVVNLSDKQFKGIAPETVHFNNLVTLLESMADQLCDCHYIGIESAVRKNPDIFRFTQHIITAICYIVKDKGNFPLIIEMDNSLKSRSLGAPKFKKSTDLKNWCFNKALEIFEEENDDEAIQNIVSRKGKKTDLTDAKCQSKALQKLIESSIES